MAGVSEHDGLTALPPVSAAQRRRLLEGLLRGVSRSFYLTLRVLPSSSRLPVGVAYLLARAADTITDTRLLPPSRRLEHLLVFREQIIGPVGMEPLRKIEAELTEKQSLPEERELLHSLPEAFALLAGLAEPDRSHVRSVVVNLTRGMENDLTTFPQEDSDLVGCIEDAVALDQYIYDVAGCVGEFWTAVTMTHVPALKDEGRQRMAETFTEFGKALQLTNVLRDIPKDLRIGRCYLPRMQLAAMGLSPEDLLDPSNGSAARPLLVAWLKAALEYYSSAEKYLLAIPRRCLRIRMAVLWPIVIGLATLASLARNEQWLDPGHSTRVSRGWVYRTMAMSWPSVHSNLIVSAWISRLRSKVEAAL